MSSRSAFGSIGAAFAHLTLAAKGVLAVAIPVAALVTAMAVYHQYETQTRLADLRIKKTLEVRDELQRIQELLGDAEDAVHHFLLTKRADALAPYREVRQALAAPMASLHRLLSDDPEELARLSEAESSIANSLSTMEQLRREEDPARRMAEAEQLVANRRRLEAQLDAMRAEEERRFLEWNASASRAERRLRVAILAGGVIGLLGGVFAMLFFMQRIRRRLKLLEEDARRVAQGLPVESSFDGGDEIARVSEALKDSSNKIAAQARELRSAHAGLETRVSERTAELSAANENLRRANEVFEAVVQSSPLAIWVLDLEGNVTFWNSGAERIFGWKEEEVVGKALPVISPVDEDEYHEWIEKFRYGWAVPGIEKKRRRKDGSLIDVVIWTAPLRDAEGHIRGTVAVDSDVSQHKLLEEQFRQSQKLEAVGRLAGGVAHDFNNLLTVIAGYAEMLVSEAKGAPRLVEYANEIQQAAGRATSLTGQLLTFSRRQRSQPRILNLNDVVTNAVRLLRRVIGEDIEVTTHLDPNLGRVRADPMHLDQVIMNLVVNARDAMSAGGQLTVETANSQLDQDYADRHLGVSAGPYCMLAISDTGTGMTPEIRARLFEPFFTTKEAGRGTGLGLSIVYGIVKQNHGEIIVYSEPGEGTTFKIFLPMIDGPSEVAVDESVPASERGTETILVCEDEEVIRKLVHAMLVRQGYHVIESDTPRRALELLRENNGPVHLLLTDVVLPKKSGFDLAQEARSLLPGLKVIFMSGYTDNRVKGSWSRDDDTPFIEKPFTAAVLTRLVRQVLNNKAATG